jgi:hypothetical protein
LVLIAVIGSALLGTITLFAGATNYPCSGKKGGANHCQGSTFICNDGSVSASKRNCSATMGTANLIPSQEMQPTAGKDCSCDSGKYCVGASGGHFCYEDDGAKSYLRK